MKWLHKTEFPIIFQTAPVSSISVSDKNIDQFWRVRVIFRREHLNRLHVTVAEQFLDFHATYGFVATVIIAGKANSMPFSVRNASAPVLIASLILSRFSGVCASSSIGARTTLL